MTPLGQWVAEGRCAYAAGQMTGQRARRLEQSGMVRSPADQRFQENRSRQGLLRPALDTLRPPHCDSAGQAVGDVAGGVAATRRAGGSP
ncbi:helicase associated domain-containing protein [Streptomyces sp. G5(2025)]|uniref:helicase associated domain-containing protein n=1 Tax=Streptomyces sp. G5(2025) TaxID=3406628 RepID=UPI003C1D819C